MTALKAKSTVPSVVVERPTFVGMETSNARSVRQPDNEMPDVHLRVDSAQVC